MSALYDYPAATRFGKTVAKDKIRQNRRGGASLKDAFRDQIDRIVWAHKLAPETLNLPATMAVTEIQVFEIHLRTPEVDETVLRAIDRAIPFPLFFELIEGTRRRVAAAHKRSNEADSSKWVVGDVLWSEWMEEDAFRDPLPTATDMGRLYERMLGALVPLRRTEEPIEDSLARKVALDAKGREIERLNARLKREKQFNRKVELHGQLQEAQAAYNHLKEE